MDYTHCIVIGHGLKPRHSFHLLVDAGGIKIDRKMNRKEQKLLSKVLRAIMFLMKEDGGGLK